MDKFYTITEAAEVLGVSKRTVERRIPQWLNEGRLKLVKIGRINRIAEDDFRKLINSLKVRGV